MQSGTVNLTQFTYICRELGILQRDEHHHNILIKSIQLGEGIVDYVLFLFLLKDYHYGGLSEFYSRLKSLREKYPSIMEVFDIFIKNTQNLFSRETLREIITQLGFNIYDRPEDGKIVN